MYPRPCWLAPYFLLPTDLAVDLVVDLVASWLTTFQTEVVLVSNLMTLTHRRYRLVKKLGYGGYSTIWLARDLQISRYVAVKVITADTSNYTLEAGLLSSLSNSLSRLGRETIPSLIDEFWVASPNGKHKCIVTPPARMSLFDAKETSTFGLFRPKVAQWIIAQLIRGVAVLHSEDTAHGGMRCI